MDGPEGRAQEGVRRADEQSRRRARELEELRRLVQRRRHRLLDEDVLARLERRLRERAVLVHARQDEHDVDVVAADHVRRRPEVGVDVVVRGCTAAPGVVDVVDGVHVDTFRQMEPLDDRAVRSGEDAAAADDAEAEAHALVPLATR